MSPISGFYFMLAAFGDWLCERLNEREARSSKD